MHGSVEMDSTRAPLKPLRTVHMRVCSYGSVFYDTWVTVGVGLFAVSVETFASLHTEPLG